MLNLLRTSASVALIGLLIGHLNSICSGSNVARATNGDDKVRKVSEQQLEAIAAELGDQLSANDFWTLVKITRIHLTDEERRVDDDEFNEDEEVHLRMIADLVQANFNKILNERRKVKARKEFDRLYAQTIVKPCQLIRSIYIRHKDAFDNAPFDKNDMYRVREKEISKVCVSFLMKKSTQNDLFKIFSQ